MSYRNAEIIGHRHKKDPKRWSSQYVGQGLFHDLLKNAKLLGIVSWDTGQHLHFKKGSKYFVYESSPRTAKPTLKDKKATAEIEIYVTEFENKEAYILSRYESDLRECKP